jgi:hypothetical protein
MKKTITSIILLATLTSCATQRYGREQDVSSYERSNLDCKQIELEIAKSESFLSDLRIKRSETNVMHVAGFLGDFGIGNAMEGDAAQNSGEMRLKQLKDLKNEKTCK